MLRRLATEPDALPRAATEALRICHINPDTGAEDEDACVRGCYRCLLTYGNQTAHERIDRRAIIPLLMAVAAGTTHLEEPATPTAPNPTLAVVASPLASPEGLAPGSRIEELIALMNDRHLAGPTRLDTTIEGVHLDLVFDDRKAAVLFADAHSAETDTLGLVMAGWNILEVPEGADLADVVDANPSVFVQVRP